MKLSKFKFNLPEESIAQYPSEHRDECKLLVLHKKTGEIEHKIFKDILEYFDEEDVFILNDTKVFPARSPSSGTPSSLRPALRIVLKVQ